MALAHSELGASSSKRWMCCPGSVALSAGLPNNSSRFAAEGSAAHALGELCLGIGEDPEAYIGEVLCDHPDYPVDTEMAEHVGTYVGYCRSQIEDGDVVLIEERVSLEPLGPKAVGMFGTADFMRFRPSTGHLLVGDLKYGQGVPVEAVDNPQGLYYGLGAVLKLAELGHKVKSVTIAIIQPRAPHPAGPIRTWDVSAFDLVEWAGELLEAAEKTRQPNAPLKASEECRFCRAAARCPELMAEAMRQAQLEFADDDCTLLQPVVASPELLGVERLTAVLAAAPMITAWINACQEHAHQQLEHGNEVPGWKLVEKRATRKWSLGEKELVPKLVELGADKDALFKQSLLSPAQVEKLLPKEARKELADFTKAESSGTTLAPEADKRPAVQSGPAADFDVVD